MAIVFNKELSVSRVALAFNNNVVEFYSDGLLSPVNANISVGGQTVTIYPNPSGVFRYNFKELIISIMNVDNYKDDLDIDIENAYTYDWSDKIYLSGDVVTTINFANETTDVDTRSITWLSGYVNLQEWKNSYPALSLVTNGIKLLQADNSDANYRNKIAYWSGYPFDVTLYNNENAINVTNNTNGLDYDFDTDQYNITRLAFSDGRTTETIEDVLPLASGYNDLVFSSSTSNFNVELYKDSAKCLNGTYIKWINKFGGYNYWLFPKGEDVLTTKSKGNLVNDFNNLEDTISPYVSLGKESGNSINVTQKRIKEAYKNLLVDLLDSAKVYLFTGTPFSQNTFNDWIEVEVKAGNYTVDNSRSDLYTFSLEFGLPKNVTRSL